MNDTTEIVTAKPTKSVLNLKFISHGTIETSDFDFARKFYEEFLGFEVVRASHMSLMIRLGGQHVYVVVPKEEGAPPMSIRNHNGVDVSTEAEVDAAHKICVRDAEIWGINKISPPMLQHGTYSFYFWDRDENSWEILCNPVGGYSWMYELGDQKGKGSMAKNFERPKVSQPAS